MSTAIIAPTDDRHNLQAEADARIAEAVEYYHHLIRHFWDPDEAAHHVDVAFGFVPPPPEEFSR